MILSASYGSGAFTVEYIIIQLNAPGSGKIRVGFFIAVNRRMKFKSNIKLKTKGGLMSDNYNLVEEYFMQVDKLFADNEFVQGKKLLEEILEMEPAYGRAHNHLGWLYYAKLDNFEKAEYHYKSAKKF